MSEGGGPAGDPGLPLQVPLDRLTRFVGRYAMLGVFLLAAGFVVARLAALSFPDPGAVLDGRDILTDQTRPNYLRNVFELLSFAAPAGLLAVAIWAWLLTRSQIEEARKARHVTLYTSLEQRWASEEMLRSKMLLTQIIHDHGRYVAACSQYGREPNGLSEYTHEAIRALKATNPSGYFALMALPEYLEYIGMLVKQRYLQIEDINYLLGMVCIQIASMLATHIDHLRQDSAVFRRDNGLPGAPRDFECLSFLEEAFLMLYRSQRPDPGL